MKKCPQCHNVFTDELIYCTNDGTPLVTENLPLPSAGSADFEPETVIRNQPFVVDVASGKIPPEPVVYQTAAAPVVIEKTSNARNYVVFLIVGLLIGGGLVLLALMLARNYYATDQAVNNHRAADVETNSANTKNSAAPPAKTINEKHLKKTNAPDDEFNGRVIVANANVRSAPELSATAIDALPKGDRINIERRENDNSPWYHVNCEHGVSGWIHGDMIEYTDSKTDFGDNK